MFRLFDFKSDKHFVASSDKTTLKFYELSNSTVHPSYIRKAHWKEIGSIIARDHDDNDQEEDNDDDEYGSKKGENKSYDGLIFFDGLGKIKGREALIKLAQHLTRLQLMVSPQGLCFQDVTQLGEHKDFGIHYLRLNDLFNWSHYGVSITGMTIWTRLVLKYTVPSRGENNRRPTTTGGVSKEKYEELKKRVRNKEEELEKLREEMEEQDEELQKLKGEMEGASEKHEMELRELEEKKDEELRKLSKKKSGELEMLKKEKDEELQKKNDELEMLRKGKDESSLESRWKQLATSRVHPIALGTPKAIWELHKSIRRPVPRDTFSQINVASGYYYMPYTSGASTAFPIAQLSMVDEESKYWPPPPKVRAFCSGGYPFDKDNWWFMKTTHPVDGLSTMLAYYDGNQTCFTGIGNYPIRFPILWNANLRTDTPFILVYVVDGFKLGFMYRD